ncbi:nitroreductase/quinone reductase family protein [Kitasatospora sp. MBT66]|uniref:nitroreductase/quinone reductase family protein n=1 Tax=Kitasatospora sp. MBT66 TaxID=1444769 RepID=UPI0005B80705|nr:nitroreductase/quinone reductase family protein [Kitasatospora sp. MBT66]
MPMSSLSFNQAVVEEFRARGGRVGGPFEGGDLLLLTTVGERSGREHTVPLGFVRADGLLLVVASAAGAPEHPQWYRNLLAHPLVRVELGTEVFDATAVPAEGDRRERLFEAVVRSAPGYGEYQRNTARLLPVVVLEQPGAGAGARDGAGAGVGAAAGEVASLADKLLEVHDWLRAQLRQLRAEAEAHLAGGVGGSGGPGGVGGAPALGLQLRQHCLAFCQGLTVHHTGEDRGVFPALARSHPELRGVLEQLAEEHRTVARLKDELVALVSDLDSAEPEAFRTALARTADELEAHLAHEERELLPALAGIPFPPPGR